jgi:hypothetical protein
MADTVFEYQTAQRGYIGFTRFWKKGDWVQITLVSEDPNYPFVYTYATMPFEKFKEAFIAVAKSVEDTKDTEAK